MEVEGKHIQDLVEYLLEMQMEVEGKMKMQDLVGYLLEV